MTLTCLGAKKSAAPVGKREGKADEMYPSVRNSLMGAVPRCGHVRMGGESAELEEDCRSCTDCLTTSCSVKCWVPLGRNVLDC